MTTITTDAPAPGTGTVPVEDLDLETMLELDDALSGDDASAGLGEEVERWLRARPQRGAHIRWKRSSVARDAVRTRAQLQAKVATLSVKGQFGVADLAALPEVWCQTMRVDGGYIVEVNGVPGPECFARRVHRDGDSEDDIFPTAQDAGTAMWKWLHGTLPAGMVLRQLSEED
ncbi:hypothetical protein [Demequina pelophila]|uniref:hypothetical protein n=1 Tax=Demequina pelophila TaxID=1638984 RepID=UPI0007815EF6|nr:hypothetical protein [Demequina pelophila]